MPTVGFFALLLQRRVSKGPSRLPLSGRAVEGRQLLLRTCPVSFQEGNAPDGNDSLGSVYGLCDEEAVWGLQRSGSQVGVLQKQRAKGLPTVLPGLHIPPVQPRGERPSLSEAASVRGGAQRQGEGAVPLHAAPIPRVLLRGASAHLLRLPRARDARVDLPGLSLTVLLRGASAHRVGVPRARDARVDLPGLSGEERQGVRGLQRCETSRRFPC